MNVYTTEDFITKAKSSPILAKATKEVIAKTEAIDPKTIYQIGLLRRVPTTKEPVYTIRNGNLRFFVMMGKKEKEPYMVFFDLATKQSNKAPQTTSASARV